MYFLYAVMEEVFTFPALQHSTVHLQSASTSAASYTSEWLPWSSPSSFQGRAPKLSVYRLELLPKWLTDVTEYTLKQKKICPPLLKKLNLAHDAFQNHRGKARVRASGAALIWTRRSGGLQCGRCCQWWLGTTWCSWDGASCTPSSMLFASVGYHFSSR